MRLICPNCKQNCETEQELIGGQHVICPFCNVKFSYKENDAEAEQSINVLRTSPILRTVKKWWKLGAITVAFLVGYNLMWGSEVYDDKIPIRDLEGLEIGGTNDVSGHGRYPEKRIVYHGEDAHIIMNCWRVGEWVVYALDKEDIDVIFCNNWDIALKRIYGGHHEEMRPFSSRVVLKLKDAKRKSKTEWVFESNAYPYEGEPERMSLLVRYLKSIER